MHRERSLARLYTLEQALRRYALRADADDLGLDGDIKQQGPKTDRIFKTKKQLRSLVTA
jgi:hypothetical protein